ncbi:TetR family transcriptional regulator [Ornithinimicrobium sp. Arc0846-15]|nr:TetR family transcriptional regulator [Ornithinimicrobium laminariae]
MTKRVHVPVATRRAQLVEAAMRVMRRDGAWALTTRAVAKDAEVPLGAVHYAFDSKTSLMRAVYAADIDSAATVLGGALNPGDDPREVLRRAVRRYAASLRLDPQVELVFQELGLMGVRDEELTALSREAVVDYRAEVARFLTQVAADAGQVWDAPVEVLAESLFGSLIGLAQNWLGTRDDALLDDCLEDVADQLARRLSVQ